MNIKKLALSIIIPLLCSACGGDHDWDDEGAQRAKEVYITKKNITVGEDTRVDVYFETKRDEFWLDPEDIQVVVKLPASLSYQANTSKLHVESLWKESREPDLIKVCDDNTTYLLYDLDDDHDFENIWVERYDISFHALGTEQSEHAIIFAQADRHVDFSCSTEFPYQSQDSLTIN